MTRLHCLGIGLRPRFVFVGSCYSYEPIWSSIGSSDSDPLWYGSLASSLIYDIAWFLFIFNLIMIKFEFVNSFNWNLKGLARGLASTMCHSIKKFNHDHLNKSDVISLIWFWVGPWILQISFKQIFWSLRWRVIHHIQWGPTWDDLQRCCSKLLV